jgi:tetratricopeptide (TPR) repeat protein
VALVGLSGVAPASVPDTARQPASDPTLDIGRGLEVPKPDLSAMEEAAQRKVRLAQSTLEQAIRAESMSPRELAEGFGFLGQLYHAYKLLDAAETCYQESNLAQPEDGRWAYLLGLTRYAKGDLERSVSDFESALTSRPGDFPTLVRLGNAMIELNRSAEAHRYFEQALQVEPAAAAAFYGLGKAAALDGEDERAIELFEQVLGLQPDASIVHYPLGQAYRRLGNREKAVEHLRQRGQDEVVFDDPLGQQVARLAKGTALEIVIEMARDEERFEEKEFLGFALSQFGEVSGTIEQLEHWLSLRGGQGEEAADHQRARLHYVVGGLQVNEGRDEEALAHFRQALDLEPDLEDARIKLGNALARSGDIEAAIGQYETVLEKEPEHVDALLKRAAARMELEQWESARVDLERLRQLDPDRVEIRARLGAVLILLDEPEAALEQYRSTLDLDLVPRERVRLSTRVAELLSARGSLDEAVAQYREALEVDSEYVPGIAGLAGLLASLNRFDEAAELYGQWAAAEPNEPRPRLAEASALIFAEEHARATSRLEEAIEAFPTILDFKDVLARHLAACPDRGQRNGARALELALVVFEQVPTFVSTETVAMAYAESGRFSDAVDWQRRLVSEAEAEQAKAPPEVLERLRDNLARYEAGESVP